MTVKELTSTISTIILVACALVVTGFVARNEIQRAGPTQTSISFERQDDWQSFATGGHRLGSANAAVTIVEFADFECPACRVLSARFRQLMKERPDDVAILYRHMPIPSHRFAATAAIASECSARVGRFHALHDSLFANQAKLGVIPWTELAHGAGIADTVAFASCLQDKAVRQIVERDQKDAERLEAPGTPTILVEGFKFTGVPSKQSLDSLVDASIARRRTSSAAR